MSHAERAREEDDAGAAGDASAAEGRVETTVEVRATGHVRDRVGRPGLRFTFEGSTLRAFLDAFLEEYDCRDLVLATEDGEDRTRGWVPGPDEPRGVESLPDDWRANPPGERTRAYARVLVNGRFNEHLDGFDTALADGDRVALAYPFIFCC
jgi:molybdopterin converting factor small subunit